MACRLRTRHLGIDTAGTKRARQSTRAGRGERCNYDPAAGNGGALMSYRLIGLGDVIAIMTGYFGIQSSAGCGCTARQRALNAWRVPIIEW